MTLIRFPDYDNFPPLALLYIFHISKTKVDFILDDAWGRTFKRLLNQIQKNFWTWKKKSTDGKGKKSIKIKLVLQRRREKSYSFSFGIMSRDLVLIYFFHQPSTDMICFSILNILNEVNFSLVKNSIHSCFSSVFSCAKKPVTYGVFAQYRQSIEGLFHTK